MSLIKRFVHWLQTEESGQAFVEYVFIVILIAMVVLGALRVMGTSLNRIFETVGNELS